MASLKFVELKFAMPFALCAMQTEKVSRCQTISSLKLSSVNSYTKIYDNDMPAVSVIIPTYNRENYLREAIDSVLSQSYHDFELIVVDDGSTDATAQTIASYNSRLIYLYQENHGPGAARNRGIKQATGEYISFLDSDDLWRRHKLKIQMELMTQNPEIKVCYTDEIWIRYGRRINQKQSHQKYSGWIFQKCLPLCIISPSSAMIHREVFDRIGAFDDNLDVCEDYDLWLRISAVYPISFINKKLIIKRGGHSDQLSHRFWGMDRFRVAALEKILIRNNLTEENRQATINMLLKKCTILANGCLKRGKTEEGRAYQRIIDRYVNTTDDRNR